MDREREIRNRKRAHLRDWKIASPKARRRAKLCRAGIDEVLDPTNVMANVGVVLSGEIEPLPRTKPLKPVRVRPKYQPRD